MRLWEIENDAKIFESDIFICIYLIHDVIKYFYVNKYNVSVLSSKIDFIWLKMYKKFIRKLLPILTLINLKMHTVFIRNFRFAILWWL